MAHGPPSGTVTFLFSDVVGSTHLWAEDPAAMSASLQVHDDIVRNVIEQHGGYVFTTAGDAFCVAFERATGGVAAAEAIQDELRGAAWPGPTLRVRLGLHLGEAEERNGDYFGPVVNLAARVESAGHGGQTLVTDVVRQAAQIDARQLGAFSLRGVTEKVTIFQVGDEVFPPLRVADSTSTNLLSAPAALIGRADDVRSARTALRSGRLVTLVAGGGTGKTRLSLAVGDEELPSRRAGVWFVDLTPVADPQGLEAAIASAMGVELTVGDATQQILEFLSDKDLLLILDNCEHVVDACADFAEAFLMRPGESVLLATSRERLDVDGERALQIPPLAVTNADSPAVQLFVERATTASSDFTVDADGLDAIVQLCRRLDGLPLAIELAAARSTILTPEELLAGIDDRFRLLHGGRRRQRQRTLESTLDWSYDLLDAEEQRALRAFGVFSGTFDLEAVARVLGVSRHVAIDHVESLVAKSLVDRISVDGVSRFRLLETTAAYAQQALAANEESQAVRDLHLDHYHRASEPFWERSLFWGFAPSVDRFSHDRSNIVAAFDWASARGRPQVAAELLSGALGALLDDDLGAMRLIDAAIAAIDDPEDPRVLTLHESRLAAATVATDWGKVLASTKVLGVSSSPAFRAIGTGWGSFLSLAFDARHSRRLLDAAEVDLPNVEPGPDADRCEDFLRVMRGLVLLYEGEFEAALGEADLGLAAWDGAMENECRAADARTAVTCRLLLGDPDEAMVVATRAASIRSPFGTMDFYPALCHIALGQVDVAEPLLRRLAVRSASGRVRLEAGTMLLLFAAMAHVEGDLDTARRLLLTTVYRRTVDLWPYSDHLAGVLGIADEYRALATPITFDEQLAHQRDCIETLQAEIGRRGWDSIRSG